MLLLKEGINNPLLFLRASPGSQIKVNLDQASFLSINVELMLVRILVVSSAQSLDCFTLVAQDTWP